MSMNPQIQKGEKYSKLEVINYDTEKKSYYCKCDCGGFTFARGSSLKSGRHKSCRCGLRKDRLTTRLPDNLAMKRRSFYSYRRRSAQKGLEFSLSFEEFITLICGNCVYCGAEPRPAGIKRELRNREFKSNGIDRIDNSIGYISNNCVSCCEICNNSKKTLRLDDWMKWIKRICEFQIKNNFNYQPRGFAQIKT